MSEGDDHNLMLAGQAFDQAPGCDLVPAVRRIGDPLREEEDFHRRRLETTGQERNASRAHIVGHSEMAQEAGAERASEIPIS